MVMIKVERREEESKKERVITDKWKNVRSEERMAGEEEEEEEI